MRALRARNSQRVIYLGSFSKTFSPGLRVGWVLAPLAVWVKLVLATEAQVLCPPSLTQYAVARYLDTQPWREQIKIFTELYRERRDATLESLTALMPAGTTWTRPEGGFYVWLKLPHGLDAKLMQPRAVWPGSSRRSWTCTPPSTPSTPAPSARSRPSRCRRRPTPRRSSDRRTATSTRTASHERPGRRTGGGIRYPKGPAAC